MGFNKHMVSFFPKTRLNSLKLKSNVGFSVLEQLLNDKYTRENLEELEFNINPHSSTKPIQNLIDQLNSPGPELKFQNLRKLSIGPFKQNFDLIPFLNLVINHDSKIKIEELKLFSQHKTSRLPDLLDTFQSKEFDSTYLFDSLYNYENLKRFCLSSFNINESNIYENPSYLQRLEFMNNIDYLELTDVGVIHPVSGSSILHTLYQFSENCRIKTLKLDIRTPGDDLVPSFIQDCIPANQLKELDIVIRSNNMQNTSLDQLIDQYMLAIQKHNLSLEKLSIELKSERNLINLEEQMQKEHLDQLLMCKFPKLKYLRVQIQFTNLIISRHALFRNMPNLQGIWVVGTNSVPLHFGSGIVHPGIFDQWWRMVSLPKSLISGIDSCLKYIKIDNCLFKVNKNQNENLEPIDSIDDLFQNFTRVAF